MHYIRLLRPPKLVESGRQLMAELLFTLTTDLGDSFLTPDEPVEIAITVSIPSQQHEERLVVTDHGRLLWKSGMRVAKPSVVISPTARGLLSSPALVYIRVAAVESISADDTGAILRASQDGRKAEPRTSGLVMPAWVAINDASSDVDVLTRRIAYSKNIEDYAEVEEEIGESIARHIWDGGLVAFSSLVNQLPSAPAPTTGQCVKAVKDTLKGKDELSILELGCGVGILGIGFATAAARVRHESSGYCTILMTDLPEAEARAKSNLARLESRDFCSHRQASNVHVTYENLDWEDARKGVLGPQAASRRWNLIVLSDCTYNVDMLPALVETLSALHEFNVTHGTGTGDGPVRTRVFLVTKPRHASEEALFDLMAAHGWETMEREIVPLPVLGGDMQRVEMYLFAKG